MLKAPLAALLVVSAAANAQAPDAGTPLPPPPPGTPTSATEVEQLKKELEKAQQQMKEMREEFRAQLATQSVAQGWQDSWVEERRKLELFVPDGYFRVRPDLLHNLDLNRAPDPSGYTLFPQSPTSAGDKTMAGVNMRFRFEPTLNVSEEVRVRLQIDALDNVLFGSTPDYAFSRSAAVGFRNDRDAFTVFSNSQTPPASAVSSLSDSLKVRRVYGEVSTPVGILRGGRMGSHWGLGMLWNDGNCRNCDFGTTVDRLMFVTEPVTGFYVTPMLDFNAEGPATVKAGSGVPIDLSNSDDSHSFVLAVARRDTEQQARARLDNNQAVFNYGLHFTYRVQKHDPAELYGNAFQNEGGDVPTGQLSAGYVRRDSNLYIPDVWVKYERRSFRLELEAAGVFGSIGNRAQRGADADSPGANQGLTVVQFGAVAQGEYKLLEGGLKLGLEVGFASGDRAPGFGNYPRRVTGDADNNTQPGDIDGPQYACQSTGGCTDNSIRNFRFDRDYRVDLILWREILGGVTDAVYARPTIDYRVAEGFHLLGAVIYSRAIFFESTPSFDGTSGDENLGLELNAGARYETEDGFFAEVMWGILFPLGGLGDKRPLAEGTDVESAQALRGVVGIHF
ncbi:MAG: TIGR04551 family protein [Myxococcota bacterium]